MIFVAIREKIARVSDSFGAGAGKKNRRSILWFAKESK